MKRKQNMPRPCSAVVQPFGLTVAEATEICGGLSYTSKMPCASYGLPAKHCQAGSRLAAREGSVCSKCYALKGRYIFNTVLTAQHRRMATLTHPRWCEAVATLILLDGHSHFRWHDSGDVQSVSHLRNIARVAELLPHVQFWLPTRELYTLNTWLGETRGVIPSNLTVRVSRAMIDGSKLTLPTLWRTAGVVESGVAKLKADTSCPAWQQQGACLLCRKCWQRDEPVVIYPLH